uniref:Ig-like domain-containing protein n=1 Tax=Scophthalmus maximus TaxID=52904 RepID=A0A8D3DTA0_SCOMX
MDGHARSRLLLLAALLSSTAGQSPAVYFVVGEPLVLTPPVFGPLNSIVWDRNGDLVVEWVNSRPEHFSSFKRYANLNMTTGQLVIKPTIQRDAGLFKVVINKVQSLTYKAQVIKRVSKPEVQMRTLTCSGDPTGAGPVTYSWRKGTGPWGPEQKSPDTILENNKEVQGERTISCRMTNPVGEEESEPLKNPFYRDPPPGHVVGTECQDISQITISVELNPLTPHLRKKQWNIFFLAFLGPLGQ